MGNSPSNSVSALLVGDFDADGSLIKDVFLRNEWLLEHARDRRQALELLRRPVHVVVAEASIPSWNWRDILWDLRNLSHSAQLIVTSRHADDCLWSEVLNEGAFDLLAQPLARDEVERVIAAASRRGEGLQASPPFSPKKSVTKAASASYEGVPAFLQKTSC